MYFIGIDPGKKGGIAIIHNNNCMLAHEMPVNSDGEIDSQTIYQILDGIFPLPGFFCVLEKAQAMPKQGVVAMFNYGKGYGEILAVLKILKIPFQEIQPMRWKKEFNLVKKDKSASIVVAEKLFPDQVFLTPKMRLMDGKAEALLLAEYAKRMYK